MSEEIVLIVNGKHHKVQAEPETALLYVLRNELGLASPQFGCGEETCGACMVLIGDQAKPSCKLPVSQLPALSCPCLHWTCMCHGRDRW